MKVVIVMPAYNEEKTIKQSLQSLNSGFPGANVVVVNDGSSDKTEEIALKEGAFVASHIINRGLGATLATGINSAIRKNADIIVTFDADLQHSGRDIKNLIEPIQKKRANAVIGSRFLRTEDLEMMPPVTKFGNWFLTGFTNLLAGTKVTDSQSGLRAFDKKAAKVISIVCDRYDVSSEIVYELGRCGMKIEEVPIKALYDERSKRKGTNVREGVKIMHGILLKRLWLRK
jgi:glycosyltransferase involved in cell wall biosynthesis